jgi:hypothetical protein
MRLELVRKRECSSNSAPQPQTRTLKSQAMVWDAVACGAADAWSEVEEVRLITNIVPPSAGCPKTAICFVTAEKFVPSRMQQYASALNFLCSSHLTVIEQPGHL